MKKVFKKVNLNKLDKAILVSFAEAVGLKEKTKKSIVDTLAKLTFDEKKEYKCLEHTILVTNGYQYFVSLDRETYSFENNTFNPSIMAAFYEAGYIMGYVEVGVGTNKIVMFNK